MFRKLGFCNAAHNRGNNFLLLYIYLRGEEFNNVDEYVGKRKKSESYDNLKCIFTVHADPQYMQVHTVTPPEHETYHKTPPLCRFTSVKARVNQRSFPMMA